MKQYTCSVKLGDSNNNIVPDKVVTVPEIAVLRAIHGAAAVFAIRPAAETVKAKGKTETRPMVKTTEDGDAWTDDMERERLTRRYQKGEGNSSVNIDQLFGGPLAPLPKTLRAIGVDPVAEAAKFREQAEAALAAAKALDGDVAPEPEEDEDAFFEDIEKAA